MGGSTLSGTAAEEARWWLQLRGGRLRRRWSPESAAQASLQAASPLSSRHRPSRARTTPVDHQRHIPPQVCRPALLFVRLPPAQEIKLRGPLGHGFLDGMRRQQCADSIATPLYVKASLDITNPAARTETVLGGDATRIDIQ